jgi:hypothetical protein
VQTGIGYVLGRGPSCRPPASTRPAEAVVPLVGEDELVVEDPCDRLFPPEVVVECPDVETEEDVVDWVVVVVTAAFVLVVLLPGAASACWACATADWAALISFW